MNAIEKSEKIQGLINLFQTADLFKPITVVINEADNQDDAEIILEALREKAERDNNPPLTEEQIRGMVGQPVFVDYNLTGTKEWAIIKSVSDMKIWFSDGMYIWLNDIDKTVDVYAHSPKKDGAE